MENDAAQGELAHLLKRGSREINARNLMSTKPHASILALVGFTLLCSALLQPTAAQAQRDASEKLPLVIAEAVSAGIEEVRERAEPGSATGPVYFDSAFIDSTFQSYYGQSYAFDYDAFRAALPPKLRGQMQAGTRIGEVRQERSSSRPGEEKYEIIQNGIRVRVGRVQRKQGKYFVPVVASYNESRRMKGQQGVGSLSMKYFIEKKGGQWKATLHDAGWLIF